jgi:hypothetical protein
MKNKKPKNGDVYIRGKRVVILTNENEVVYLNEACEHSTRGINEINGEDQYVCNAQDLCDWLHSKLANKA